MPSGRVHLRIEAFLLAVWLAAGGFLLSENAIDGGVFAAFVAGYVFSMLLLSPDLDLSSSRASRRWGILRLFWWPYAKLFRHRRVSHHWLWGTTTRIVYLSVLVVAVGWGVLAATGRTIRVDRLPRWPIFVAAAAGLYAPNVAHILADAASTFWRRRRPTRL